MEALGKLTPQERAIAALTTLGLSNDEIADRLHVSPATIPTHKRNIHEKLRINKAIELVRICICEIFEITDQQLKEKLREIGALCLTGLLCFQIFSSTDSTMIRRAGRRSRRNEYECVTEL